MSVSKPADARTDTRVSTQLVVPDAIAIVALVGIGVGIPLLLVAAAGAIGLPTGDDWVYMRGASSLFTTGGINMPGHTTAATGQLLLVQPLLWLSGGASWAFTAFGLTMGLLGIVATYLLARWFLGVGSSVVVVLLVIVFPGFARETASFVTDVPAYALGMLCLLLGVRWLHGDGGLPTLAAALGIGLLAVSVREFALAAPVAILLAAWARNRRSERAALVAGTIAFSVGVVGVELVGARIPGRGFGGDGGFMVPVLLAPTFLTLAAALLPAAILAAGWRMGRLRAQHVLAGAGIVVVAMVLVPGGPFLWGYLVVAGGAAPDAVLSGVRAAILPSSAWVAARQLALFAATLVATLVIASLGDQVVQVRSASSVAVSAVRIAQGRKGPLILFVVLYAAGLAVFGSVNTLFERYLYPVVPVAAILLLSGVETGRLGRSRAFSHAALAWLGILAFAITANSLAYGAARIRAGDAAVALGYAPGTVDAGYEWVGEHGSGTEIGESHDYGLMWYDDLWSSFHPCAVLSNSPLEVPGYILIHEDPAAYRQYLLVGLEQPLYLYGSTDAGCPSPPTTADGAGPG